MPPGVRPAWFRVAVDLGQTSDADISVSKFSLAHPLALRRRASRWRERAGNAAGGRTSVTATKGSCPLTKAESEAGWFQD